MTTVSLVIRCFNEEQHIGRLLSGVMEQSVQDVEIIVVDSGSTDATVSIASHYPVQIVTLRPEEFSFGYSLNLGCRAATGDVLVFASAHVYPVYHDWLEQLVAPFADPTIALVYGKQRGDASTHYSEHQVFARWFGDQSNLRQTHPFCNNANAAVRAELWRQHPYDETLTGLEDIDWARWALAKGYTLAYNADAEVIHVHNETPQRIYHRYRREALALKRIFPNERFGWHDWLYLLTTNIINDSRHALHERRLVQTFGNIVMFRTMQFSGTYRGFRESGQLSSDVRRTLYYPQPPRQRQRGNGDGQVARRRIDYTEVWTPTTAPYATESHES